MGNIPSAKPSPRVVNGVMHWYEDDKFIIDFKFNILDQDGEAVTIASTDKLVISFYDMKRQNVANYSFTEITGNAVSITFDETESAKFKRGNYYYTARLFYGDYTAAEDDESEDEWEYETTIISNDKVVVE